MFYYFVLASVLAYPFNHHLLCGKDLIRVPEKTFPLKEGVNFISVETRDCSSQRWDMHTTISVRSYRASYMFNNITEVIKEPK
jgi:hypothetical protein